MRDAHDDSEADEVVEVRQEETADGEIVMRRHVSGRFKRMPSAAWDAASQRVAPEEEAPEPGQAGLLPGQSDEALREEVRSAEAGFDAEAWKVRRRLCGWRRDLRGSEGI